LKKPDIAKERGLVKGAMRRIFSRSELRRKVLQKNSIEHHDENRPRVKKWSWCQNCGQVFPQYLAQVDHREPLVPIGTRLEDMSWDTVVERLWCSESNLQVLCVQCHDEKSSVERKLRKASKK
jgi:5-methylcytosine-specific restriction endonuclease McrA